MSARVWKVEEVFTPNDTPTITYVGRKDLNLEADLRAYCGLSKMIVSVSGPSKSGKTVLISKVVDDALIIPVIGSGIRTAEELWDRALQWMDVPKQTTSSVNSISALNAAGKVGGEAGIPFITKAKADISLGGSQSWGTSSSSTMDRAGLTSIIREIANSDFVIFLDDFHYIPEDLRAEVGRQLKVAADNGVKIVTASVPHRTDDVVRSNHELRGRVAGVNVGYWEHRHLKMILRQGFDALNVELSASVETRLCNEAMGSPQLMQTICFCLCQVLGVTESKLDKVRVEVTEEQISKTLTRTSHFTDFTKVLASLHAGPKARGQERKEHELTDGTTGDVYRAVLLAIKANPINSSFTYDEIMTRVKSVCVGSAPVGSSVTSCLEQMHNISEDLQPTAPVLAWDGDNLDIIDPYFAFFLRSSTKIASLASS